LAGIYIHIPFCRQACHYCNFHFTTSARYKNELVGALLEEIRLQKKYLGKEAVHTIYFGGGTPSLLEPAQLTGILNELKLHFDLSDDTEITLEVNPEDISVTSLNSWKGSGINRLSIGVQSFFDEDLVWMNRSHNAAQTLTGVKLAVEYFRNINIDLIYGHPGLSDEKWKQNVETALALAIPHLSCYALTVEPATPLHKMIRDGKKENTDPGTQAQQFLLLMEWLENAGYEHYEISNFARPGFRSRHNTAYWEGKIYLGLGPSAHSFDRLSRQWNISNNTRYIESIQKGMIPFEKEILSPRQAVNEYIMTSLRTVEGLRIEKIPESDRTGLMKTARKFIDNRKLIMHNNRLILTREGKLFADGIAADLFLDQ